MFLRVPNTNKGRKFIKALKQSLSAGVHIKVRGRGPRAVHEKRHHRPFRAYLPLKLAAWFAVYLTKGEA